VLHAHVHVLPRREGDGVPAEWPRGGLTEERGREVAAALRDAL
jgi:diadenosine tetraphosphate (Ap4A) HIT family hydrolase